MIRNGRKHGKMRVENSVISSIIGEFFVPRRRIRGVDFGIVVWRGEMDFRGGDAYYGAFFSPFSSVIGKKDLRGGKGMTGEREERRK